MTSEPGIDVVALSSLAPNSVGPDSAGRCRKFPMHPMSRALLLVFWFQTALVPLSAQWLGRRAEGIPRLANGQPDLSAPAPKMADGTPDLSGTWKLDQDRLGIPKDSNFQTYVAALANQAPFRPTAAALQRAARENNYKDAREARCIPWAAPLAGGPAPWKIVQTRPLIAILHEDFNHFRQIYLDGRSLPKDPDPTWLGYSVGRWEADTLVIESAGFNGKIDLPGGAPSTEALRITERYRRRDFGHLERTITINDPSLYTKPWTYSIDAILVPDDDVLENICVAGEKDQPHLVGK